MRDDDDRHLGRQLGHQVEFGRPDVAEGARQGADAVALDRERAHHVGIDDAAMERSVPLIEWLSNNGKTWATSGQIPARLSVQDDPDVQAIWSVKSAAENFNNYGKTDVPHKAFIEIQTAWEAAVSAAVSNTQPIEEAMNEGTAAIQAILDRG